MLAALLQQFHMPIVTVHALAGAVGVGSAVVLDVLFFYFLKDLKISHNENKVSNTISNLFMVALGFLYITGILLFLSDVETYSTSVKFLTKMVVVVILTINGFFLHNYIAPRMKKLNFKTYTPRKRHFYMLAFSAGAISMTSWTTAYVLGTQSSIPFTLQQALGLYGSILCIAVIFSVVLLHMLKRRAR